VGAFADRAEQTTVLGGRFHENGVNDFDTEPAPQPGLEDAVVAYPSG